MIHVVAAQERIAPGGQHLEHLAPHRQHGQVEGAAAHVEHGQPLVELAAHAVGQRRRGGLVEHPQHREAGRGRRPPGGLALAIVEVGRHRDHALADGLADVLLGQLAQVTEHGAGDLDRRLLAAAGHHQRLLVGALDHLVGQMLDGPPQRPVAERPADEALDREDGVAGIDHPAEPRRQPHHHLAAGLERHHRRVQPLAFQ